MRRDYVLLDAAAAQDEPARLMDERLRPGRLAGYGRTRWQAHAREHGSDMLGEEETTLGVERSVDDVARGLRGGERGEEDRPHDPMQPGIAQPRELAVLEEAGQEEPVARLAAGVGWNIDEEVMRH